MAASLTRATMQMPFRSSSDGVPHAIQATKTCHPAPCPFDSRFSTRSAGNGYRTGHRMPTQHPRQLISPYRQSGWMDRPRFGPALLDRGWIHAGRTLDASRPEAVRNKKDEGRYHLDVGIRRAVSARQVAILRVRWRNRLPGEEDRRRYKEVFRYLQEHSPRRVDHSRYRMPVDSIDGSRNSPRILRHFGQAPLASPAPCRSL